MRLRASDHYLLYQPSPCERRVYLAHHATDPFQPGAFEEHLFALGRRHEQQHLAWLRQAFDPVLDLSEASAGEAAAALRAGAAPVLYQARLEAEVELDGEVFPVEGRPDFLIRGATGWVVRDAKLSQDPTPKSHPQVARQLQLYGWLVTRLTGEPPAALQVHTGLGEDRAFPGASEAEVLAALRELVALRRAPEEPYSPVGYSKCKPCLFSHHCLDRAQAEGDLALARDVDQGLARALHEAGVDRVDQLLAAHDEDSLAEVSRPWGRGQQRVGPRRAAWILRSARAMHEDRPVVVARPALPEDPNLVMFDLEGVPPFMGGEEQVYLWGMQVFGEDPGPYLCGLAPFTPDGDAEGWSGFLARASALFEAHGDLPFVHWGSYEKAKLSLYIQRHGDPDGTARRVLANLVDLLPVTKAAVALPLPSYSLKVIEGYVGFSRALQGYAGDQSIVRWVQALESDDEALRQEVVDEVLTYNREDLAATWAVFEWLRSLEPEPSGTLGS